METFKWQLIGEDTQLTTRTTFIKSIILFNATATNVVLYNEATSSKTAGAMFLTLYTTAEELTKMITFDKPCQLDAGCFIDWSAGGVLIQYKPV